MNNHDLVKYDRIDDGYPKLISAGFKGWPSTWYSGIDSAMVKKSLPLARDILYFFRGPEYIAYQPGKGVLSGYPKRIADGWKNWPEDWADGIDAATLGPDGKYYFFKMIERSYSWGKENRAYCLRYTPRKGVDTNYPRPLDTFARSLRESGYYHNAFLKGLIAASSRHKFVFLYGVKNDMTWFAAVVPNKGIYYNLSQCDYESVYRVDAENGWGYNDELGEFLHNMDAEILHPNGRVYNFKGDKYIRRSMRFK